MSPILKLRIATITRNMRLVASSLEVASGPQTLREATQALSELNTLVLMALYQWDMEIVQNVGCGYSPRGGN